jgi:phosphate transport system permease protein
MFTPTTAFAALLILAAVGFFVGRQRAVATAGGSRRALHSLPAYHGLFVALWTILPAVVFLLAALALQPLAIDYFVLRSLPDASAADARNASLLLSRLEDIAFGRAFGDISDAERAAAERLVALRSLGQWTIAGGATAIAAAGFGIALWRIATPFRARNRAERILIALLMLCSALAILTTIGIVLSVLFEAIRFFERVPLTEFFFGLTWSAQTAMREGQVASQGVFGAIPLFVGTFLITGIAVAVAVPIGLLSAIYMVEFATPRARAIAKPLLEILAGVPTVVYGFFAAITVAPAIRDAGQWLGLNVDGQSALAAGTVMGIMIIPFVSSLSDDAIAAVPKKMRDGALSMGATHGETVTRVVLPAAVPGLVGAVLLAVSRGIGETMIVLMAAGLYANLTVNPLQSVTTVTVQIATLLTGDQEFDSAKTLSAFALGLVLFVMTLCLNVVALRVVNRYRQKYQ